MLGSNRRLESSNGVVRRLSGSDVNGALYGTCKGTCKGTQRMFLDVKYNTLKFDPELDISSEEKDKTIQIFAL